MLSLREFHLKSIMYFAQGLFLSVLAVAVVIVLSILLHNAINASTFWSGILYKALILIITIANIVASIKAVKFVKENRKLVIIKTEREKSMLSFCATTALIYGYSASAVFVYASIRTIFG